MRWMLEELGNPERHIKCVHLAGTNGKGSTLTYMRYMLEGAKYKVGRLLLLISKHLMSVLV